MSTDKKNFFRREWPLALKLAIVAGSLWFIYRQLAGKDDLDEFLSFYQTLSADPFNRIVSGVVVILMAVNWWLEAYKWKVLVDKFENVSLLKAVRATLSGITVSFFTPNRVGEFAGRIMHISPQFRVMAMLATFIGSASQLLITVIFGLIGLAFFLPGFLSLDHNYFYLFLAGAVLISALLMNMFFHFGFLTKMLHHLKMLHRFDKYLAVFEKYSTRELLAVFLYSGFRYIVFTFQFVILLKIMGVGLDLVFLFGLVTVVYLALTLFPTIFLTELPLRGSVAVYVIGQFSQEHLAILCASFTIWLVNLVVPAVIGSLSVLYIRFTK